MAENFGWPTLRVHPSRDLKVRFVRIQFDTWLWTFTWTWNSRICREVFPSIRKVFLWIWSFLTHKYRSPRISLNFKYVTKVYFSHRLIRCHLYTLWYYESGIFWPEKSKKGFLIMQIIYCVINDFIFLLRCPTESS